MSSINLTRTEAEDGDLPRACLRCGAPARYYKEKWLSWHPPWVLLLALLALLPYAIAALLLSRRMRLRAWLCGHHQHHWLWRALVGWGSFLGLVGLAVAIPLAHPAVQRAYPDRADLVAGLLCLGVVFGLPLLLVVLVVLRLTSVRATFINDTMMTLEGVAPGFVDAVEEQRGREDDRVRSHASGYWSGRQAVAPPPSLQPPAPDLPPIPLASVPESGPPPRPLSEEVLEAFPPAHRAPELAPAGPPADPTALQAHPPQAPAPQRSQPAGNRACPSCAAPWPGNAVLCIECGYDVRTRKRRKVLRVGSIVEGRAEAAPPQRSAAAWVVVIYGWAFLVLAGLSALWCMGVIGLVIVLDALKSPVQDGPTIAGLHGMQLLLNLIMFRLGLGFVRGEQNAVIAAACLAVMNVLGSIALLLYSFVSQTEQPFFFIAGLVGLGATVVIYLPPLIAAGTCWDEFS